MQTLVEALPSKDDSGARVSVTRGGSRGNEVEADDQATRLQELQAEMLVANNDYKEALAQAEELLGELKEVLRVTLGDGTERNIVTSLTKLGIPQA